MLDGILKIKANYYLDGYSVLIFLLVTFSFPKTYKFIAPVIVLISLFQIFRFITGKISANYFFQNYLYLLIYSLIFFRSIHSIILSVLLVFLFIYFKTKKPIQTINNYRTEIVIVIYFGLILINQLIFEPILKDIDTYLYVFLYPILFICIKRSGLRISKHKSQKAYISSVLVATILLIILNGYNQKIALSTNTFFAEYLGLTHVYYGMFLGVANCFLLIFYIEGKTYLSKYFDVILFLLFVIVQMHIGARMSLIAIFMILVITLYKKLSLQWYRKGALISFTIIILLTLSYKTIPRAKDDVKYINKVYTSIKEYNKQDLVDNSWRNMYQRFLVTDYSIKEIKEHNFLGIGLQNVTDEVSDKIINDGYKYFNPINTHNQYLHTWLGMGLFAFIFFIGMLFYFFKNHSYSYYFLAFFLIIMITESILVRVKGISLFFLFTLIFSLKEKYIHD